MMAYMVTTLDLYSWISGRRKWSVSGTSGAKRTWKGKEGISRHGRVRLERSNQFACVGTGSKATSGAHLGFDRRHGKAADHGGGILEQGNHKRRRAELVSDGTIDLARVTRVPEPVTGQVAGAKRKRVHKRAMGVKRTARRRRRPLMIWILTKEVRPLRDWPLFCPGGRAK